MNGALCLGCGRPLRGNKVCDGCGEIVGSRPCTGLSWDQMWEQDAAARARPPTTTTNHAPGTGTTPYGAAALAAEAKTVATAPQGTRNDTLNRAGFAVGQLVAGGEIDHGDAWTALDTAADTSGLAPREIDATIRSGLGAGMKDPRSAPPSFVSAARALRLDPGAEPERDDLVPSGRASMRDRLLTVSDLSHLQPVRPLIDGLLYRDTLAQLSGPPGEYKSFMAIAMACAVARGGTFEGHPVPEAGPVVYVAAEGATGTRARILAWCEKSAVDPSELEGKLFVLPEPIQLGDTLDVTEAADMARDVSALLLILDTRARCTLGLEENSATEQGRAIQHAEEIQRASGATVLAVHHSGRSGDHGRGSTAWDGAVWSDLRMSGEDLRAKVTCAKHKDVPDGCDHHFRLVPHTVSPDLMPGADEVARSTLVLVQNGFGQTQVVDTKNARLVQEVLWTNAPPEGFTAALLAAQVEAAGGSRSGTYSAVKALVRRGAVANIGTDKRSRYVAAHPRPTTEGEAQ